ncbi:MAG: hypothetical protein LBS67_01160 [Clostridiales Family XIII bacterium]|jgi:hypothetical protein|nr:hypothetical protein [Clostridiales Family XIII bacterium]
MLFDAKKVFIIVGIIVGIMSVIIIAVLYAAGIFSFNERDAIYEGTLNDRYLTTAALTADSEPLDSETASLLTDSDNATILPDTAEDSETTDSGLSADAAEDRILIRARALLFQEDGELVASGFALENDSKFALIKSVNYLNVKSPGDFPHMNRTRDMLSYGEVDDVLEAGGYFRVERDGYYLSGRITPELSTFLE